MATLLLTSAAGAASSALGLGTMGHVALGAAAAIGGGIADAALFGTSSVQRSQGPRLKSVDITGSTEGAPIARLYGRSRLAGQMIWATRFEEEVSVQSQTVGGGLFGIGATRVRTTSFRYFANFAIGLCEGPVSHIGRIWADGREIDQMLVTVRSYPGADDQLPDSLIEAKEGAGNAPAFRGLAYVVFDRLPLEAYGNRIPQITVEVFRPVGELESKLRAVTIIPGTTEFGYEPQEVTRRGDPGTALVENRHTTLAESDWEASLSLLQALAPECKSVILVVSWFGEDLRCGSCSIQPKVDNTVKTTRPVSWQVAGLSRSQAALVSQVDGKPAFGGAPNDTSVIAAIADLKTRGFAVTLYPFIVMDIPAGNTQPDPYSDGAATNGQAAYPWRGRITVSPAAGFEDTADKTADAAVQISTFLGIASAADFVGSGDKVDYSGPPEWSYRRFILHLATLANLAGGVDGFCLGSEMVALTRARDEAGTYPFVDGLIDLAGEVRTILGATTRIGYAADWSEYHSHRPDDGTGDVIFNLDPLWANDEIDFIGIDNYLPLADWREGTEHLDRGGVDGPVSIYDKAYLQSNIEGGEYYDWFYASPADRDSQVRTPIADTDPASEPWVFRNKDIRNWWSNTHHNRTGGVRDVSSTSWVAQSKPIWFTELGCPAVDKGANQPNVFFDPKSSESLLPHYSNGARDDAMPRAFLEAVMDYWSNDANNPVSSVYAGRMIDTTRIHVWTWDARMQPSFPEDAKTWADAPNWDTGHWLNARLGSSPGSETMAQLFSDFGFSDGTVEPIGAVVDGLVIDRVIPARQVLEVAATAYQADLLETEGLVRVTPRLGRAPVVAIGLDGMTDTTTGMAEDRYSVTRTQEIDLPNVVKITYGDPVRDDQPASIEARRLSTTSRTVASRDLAVVMAEARARMLAEYMLHEEWTGRETVRFGLPPSALALDPGDIIHFTTTGEDYRITEIEDGEGRRLTARRFEPMVYSPLPQTRRSRTAGGPQPTAVPVSVFIDGPLLRDGDLTHAGYVAAFASPWPGAMAFYRSPGEVGFVLDTIAELPAALGETVEDFKAGAPWRWNRTNVLVIRLYGGTLSGASALSVLNGSNVLALETAEGVWEIVQFTTAELIAERTYALRGLLRGQRGTEQAIADPLPAGARVVRVDSAAMIQPAVSVAETGLPLQWRIGPLNRDHGDPTFETRELTVEGRARRPLAPVHVTGSVAVTNGDLTLSWIRRTRVGGDSWATAEVPLGEETEEYEVDILGGDGAAVRTIATSTPLAVYTAAQQAEDFSPLPGTLDIVVHQISTTVGRGSGARTTVAL